eukprot:scaffold263899_cov25-Prasinocladus_malaysianus.AAC.2
MPTSEQMRGSSIILEYELTSKTSVDRTEAINVSDYVNENLPVSNISFKDRLYLDRTLIV